MTWRSTVFLLGFAVMATAMFYDFQALMGVWQAIGNMRPDMRYALVHLPFVVLAAVLFAHAQVFPRLPEHPAWYVVLGVLAVARLVILQVSIPFVWVTRPALIVIVVLVLLRLKPHVGDRYQASMVPGFTAFVGFTMLLAMSLPPADMLFMLFKAQLALPRQTPIVVPTLVLAAGVAGIFILASGIRHRLMQANPGVKWLWPGVVLAILVEAVDIGMRGFFKAELVLAVRVAAHLMLFVGAFYILANLLPRRRGEELI